MIRNSLIIIVLFHALLYSCSTKHLVHHHEHLHSSLKDSPTSSKFDSIIAPFKMQLKGKMDQIIAVSAGDLTKDGTETSLGNFICDAIKWTYDSITDTKSEIIVLMNRGGMRANIGMGEVTVNHMFELMPFENELLMVELKGTEIKDIVNAIVHKKHAFYGLQISITNKDTIITTNKGEPIMNDRSYTLVTSDYLTNGGDNFTFGKKALRSVKMNVLLRDALIYYCMHLTYDHMKITPYTDGRFKISK